MDVSTTGVWLEDLRHRLTEQYGSAHGDQVFARYAEAFPQTYRDAVSTGQATADISALEGALASDGPPSAMLPHLSVRVPDGTRLALLWSAQSPALLADVFPVLENMGLRIADHRSFDIRPTGSEPVRIEEFQLIQRDSVSLADGTLQGLLETAFTAIWNGEAGDDGFNRLILQARLSWREVAIVRGIYAYLRQAGRPFSQAHVERTLVTHAEAARLLMALFAARFDPAHLGDGPESEVREQLIAELHSVDNLNEDRVLRAALAFVDATVRTNYFRRDETTPKPYLVCKLDPGRLPFLPAPRPAVETFVYSTRMEGLHLRAARVARGGIRWSDRPEDYRDEVLALMKAQMVKNAVIVPHGAKGAFVLKRPPESTDQEALAAEVRACYATFIRGLLDVTDNQVNGQVVPPPRRRLPRRTGSLPGCRRGQRDGRLLRPGELDRRRVRLLVGGCVRLRRVDRVRPQGPGHHCQGRVGVHPPAFRRARRRRRPRRAHGSGHRGHVRRRVRQRHAPPQHQADRRLRPPARIP